jgi:hypothetical protein
LEILVNAVYQAIEMKANCNACLNNFDPFQLKRVWRNNAANTIVYMLNEACPDKNDNLISFNFLADEFVFAHVNSSMYLCQLLESVQLVPSGRTGRHTLMKCGRNRPIVYFAMSVVSWLQAAPNKNMPMYL